MIFPDTLMKQAVLLWSLGSCLLAMGGCSSRFMPDPDNIPLVYKIDVQQGNVVTQDMLAQLTPGMEKNKVRFIMGTPLLIDAFHQDRWDYVYTTQEGGGSRAQRNVALFFKNDRLERVEGNVKTAQGKIMREQRKEVSVDVPGENQPGWFDRLWGKIGLGDDDEGSPKGKQEDTPFDPANPDASGGL
jgi:outer membrane protein assembly factor BamE